MSRVCFEFRDSYLPAAEARGAIMPLAAEALNQEGRRLRERGEISAAIAKHQEAMRLKSDAARHQGEPECGIRRISRVLRGLRRGCRDRQNRLAMLESRE